MLFGHHFAAIAGAGPLVGPVLAAQMGYLPGTLWILAGVVFAGAVQDMTVLFLSTRRDGRSLGDMIRSELGPVAGGIAGIGILLIMIILLAVLALVVVKALVGSPWGTFTVVCDHPDRAADGGLQPLHPARADRRDVADRRRAAADRAARAGRPSARRRGCAPGSTCPGSTLALMIIGYGFVASVLPVWLLLAPRDYLSTFLKVGTILLLALGIIVRAARSADGADHPLHRRQRTGLVRQPVSVPVHHHRLRRRVGLSRADRVGHDAEDDRERNRRSA